MDRRMFWLFLGRHCWVTYFLYSSCDAIPFSENQFPLSYQQSLLPGLWHSSMRLLRSLRKDRHTAALMASGQGVRGYHNWNSPSLKMRVGVTIIEYTLLLFGYFIWRFDLCTSEGPGKHLNDHLFPSWKEKEECGVASGGNVQHKEPALFPIFGSILQLNIA